MRINFPVWLESLIISLAIATLEAGVGFATSGSPVTVAGLIAALGAGGANFMTSYERSHNTSTTQIVEDIVNAVVAAIVPSPVTVNVQGQNATSPVEVVNPAPEVTPTPDPTPVAPSEPTV